ncbi:MAG: DUF3465 domain-containing protein [Candidatus Eremiobacteraeota bacterium]|nr:DUF3465 domain-containing protein [Candidatus Eremiobacteraeota bacterium]MBC5826353.1 DUF3465 domain-containing protein [Candidatus Eremiobacteraeota bacterium]
MALVGALALTACTSAAPDKPDNARALRDIRDGRDGAEVVVEGPVLRVERPSRGPSGVHERFLISLSDPDPAGRVPEPHGLSVLVADNISIASAVVLHIGDEVVVKGVLALDPAGPVIHWTHRDPRLRHEPGFVEVRGHVYD